MTYTPDTPILGPSLGVGDAISEWAIGLGAKRPDDVRLLFSRIDAFAKMTGIAAHVAKAQVLYETADRATGVIPFQGEPWVYGCNPAGIGVESDKDWHVYDFGDGANAARAYMIHLALYALGTVLPGGMYSSDDPRWDNAVRAGYAGIARTIGDLGGRWSTQATYGKGIAAWLNRMEAAGLLDSGFDGQEPQMAGKPTIVLVAGHNSIGDGGDEVERSLTPNLAKAYKAAFEKAGYPVVYVNPTKTPGGLTGLSLATAKAIAEAKTDLVILFDLHFNTRKSAVHVVIPHNRTADGRAMLDSAFPQGRVVDDVASNNTLDVKLAVAVAQNIVLENTGMTLRSDATGFGKGVMLENETRVGLPKSQGGLNSRLGIMGATAQLRLKAIRITVEHGGTDDAARDDFYNRCATAAVNAVERVVGGRIDTPIPAPPPTEPETGGDPGAPTFEQWAFGAVGEFAFDPKGEITNLWLERGKATGKYPRLDDVLIGEDRRFLFRDGSVAVHVPGSKAKWLEGES